MVRRVASARPQLIHKLITRCLFTTIAGENISREKGKNVSLELLRCLWLSLEKLYNRKYYLTQIVL